MNINFNMQENDKNSLIDCIKLAFEEKPKKVYLLAGTLKEEGFKLIEEEMIDSTAKFVFAVGIDKKHTLRSMLETMLQYTKDVYVYSNNQNIEYKSNVIAFEYANKAVIYNSASDITESDLKDNIVIYSKIEYDLNKAEDKESFKEFTKNIVSKLSKEKFEKITKAKIDELVDSKEIFSTKQYNHSVKSISELLGKSKETANDKNEAKEEKIEIPKFDLSDEDIDIDFDFSGLEIPEDKKEENKISKEEEKSKEKIIVDEESLSSQEDDDLKFLDSITDKLDEENSFIDKDNELYDETLEDSEFDENNTLDIEDLLFSKADVKLDIDKDTKKENKKEEKSEESNEFDDESELVQVKKVNLNNVSNLIFELPSKPLKGQDVTNLKIPNYVKQMIPEFFGFNEDSKNVEIDGINYKVRDISIEIIDAKTNQKYTDREAKLMQKQGQTYITFTTNKLQEINYDENDIARIIKLSDNVYHIEIISKDLQEYKLWSKICNQKFKSSTRKYGMM